MIFYSVKAVPEYLPLLNHHVPVQPALHGFHHQAETVRKRRDKE